MLKTQENCILHCAIKNKSALFGDKRLERRAIALLDAMLDNCSVVINRIGKDTAEKKAFYNLFKSDKVPVGTFISCGREQCNDFLNKDMHVLAINDTTAIDLKSHSGRVKQEELGAIGKGKSLGFFLHPTLILDAHTGQAFGLSSIQMWVRASDQGNKQEREYEKLSIEEKESYKWIKAAKDTKQSLKEVKTITMVADRESDIYEEFAVVPDERTQILVRSSSNRRLYEEEEKLYQVLKKQEVAGTYRIEVPSEKRLGRERRVAEIEVRFKKVRLERPKRANKELAKYVEVYAIEARERKATIPRGETGILWRLLTTHEIENFEQARQAVIWYSERWQVEQLNRTIKRQGLNVGATELESGKAIMKMTALGLQVALKVMQLVTAREGSDVEAEIAFNEEEIACLAELGRKLEGETEKQKNPHKQKSLSWVSWIIAKLGGWSGYQSQRPAGVITIYRGLKRFEDIFLGWQLPHHN